MVGIQNPRRPAREKAVQGSEDRRSIRRPKQNGEIEWSEAEDDERETRERPRQKVKRRKGSKEHNLKEVNRRVQLTSRLFPDTAASMTVLIS